MKKFLRGVTVIFMAVKVVEFVDMVQGGIRYNRFINKVDHTDFAWNDKGKPSYTFHMKDGSIVKQDHDVYAWSFYWF